MKKLIGLLLIALFFTVDGTSQLLYYNWYPVISPVTSNLNTITFNNSAEIYILGNSGTIVYSLNTGTNWNVAGTGVSANLYSVNYGSTIIYVAGASGTIIKSSNNGVNWSAVNSPTTNTLYSISNYVSNNYRMICGDGGKIYTTVNSGVNWVEVPSGTINALRCNFFSSGITNYRSFICGDNGTFLKLILAYPPIPVTITVLPYSTGVTNTFYAVSCLGDTSKLMLAGSGGIILKSVNGGINWTQQSSGTSNAIRFINAVTENDIWTGGDNGTILHTTNSGANWFPQIVNSSANINSMIFTSVTKAIAVGSGGTILTCDFPNPSIDTTIRRIKLEGNNISTYLQTTGIYNQNTTTSNSPGLEWPKGSGKYACFSSGLSISAMVSGNLRQAMCSYRGEYRTGTMISGMPEHPAILNKVYSIKTGDNCNNSLDWGNWGSIVPYGAPYVDVNHNGQYDACIDTPGVRNASQIIFMALTDGFPASHTVSEGFGGGTLPLNADLKVTAWCYNDSVVKDVQFMKFDIINRGTLPWNNVYMALVGDFDLGDALDDYLAMDSARNMWIGYNGDNNDGVYGVNPPAMGMRVLKFPVNNSAVPKDTIRTTAGVHFICASCNPPPCETDPNGEPVGAYNMMKGFKKDMSPWMNPIFTPPAPTKFIYSGEPEPNSGWTEPKGCVLNCGGPNGTIQTYNPPGDRRYLLSMGKDNFTMAPGDSQSIIVAQLVARGTSNLNSVTKLKQLSDLLSNYLVSVNIIQISSLIPGGYSLSQNYPNPFNPETKIKFDIPKQGLVKLNIYDMLGREVATLVKESLHPGTYEVVWNASDFPSGVYFYQLNSGNYSETKKLLLIK